MTTFTWAGAVSADWNTASDWTPSGGPPNSTADTALINATGSYAVSIAGGEDLAADQLALVAAGAALDVAGGAAPGDSGEPGGTLTVGSAITVAAGATLDIAGGAGYTGYFSGSGGTGGLVTLGTAGALANAGTLEIDGGGSGGYNAYTPGAPATGGTLAIDTGSLLTNTGALVVGGGAEGATNFSSVSGAGGGLLSVGSDSGLINDGTLVVAGGSGDYNGNGGFGGVATLGSDGTLTNVGLLDVQAGGADQSGGAMIGGTLMAGDDYVLTNLGVLKVDGSSDGAGALLEIGSGSTLANGSTLDIGGGGETAGTLSIGSQSTLGNNGTIDVAGGDGYINVNNQARGGPGGMLTVGAGGSISNAGALSIDGGSGGVPFDTYAPGGGGGTMDIGAGSTMTNSGTLTVAGGDGGTAPGSSGTGGTLDVGSASSLTNIGTIAITGGGGEDFPGTAGTGGTILLEQDSTLTNGGTILISGGGGGFNSGPGGAGGVLSIDPGSTLINDGTLQLTGGSTSGDNSGNGTGGVLALASGATLGGSGLLAINAGATLSLAGTAFVGDTPLFSGGTEIVAGGYTVSNADVAGGGLAGLLVALGGEADGITVGDGGTEAAQSGGVAGGVTIDGGLFDLQGGATLNGAILFANGGTLQIDSALPPGNTISGFGGGDTIDLTALPYDIAGSATVVAGNTLAIVENGSTLGLQLDPSQDFNLVQFQTAPDPSGTGTDVTAEVPCFLAGTLITTPAGEVPVETLAVGDRVLTLRGKARPIVWIGTGRALAVRGRRNAATPVIVRKGALADNVPHHDLRVTKGHSLYLDGVLIPAEFLVNHRSILWDDRAQEVEIYHIELETHDVLRANGAAAETYRDDGNRWLFRNANPDWHLPPQPPCAPVLTGGDVVDAVWARLLDRAGPRGGLPLTDDPDLHLLVDGKRVDPVSQRGEAVSFWLPRRPREVRLRSRSGVPQELGFARDARCLGVAVRRIMLIQPGRQRNAEAAVLADGYHPFEPDLAIRWTDGDAAVPPDLFAAMTGPGLLIVQIGGTTRYPDDGAVARVA